MSRGAVLHLALWFVWLLATRFAANADMEADGVVVGQAGWSAAAPSRIFVDVGGLYLRGGIA